MSENKRPTIVDVATLAGVSITTVSRVINGNYPVSEKTKSKVNIAIEELGFSPNLLARSLIQDKTYTIGILTPSIENLFFSEVIRGADDFLKKKQYRTFLCNTEGKVDDEKEMVKSLVNRSVDGIIVIDPRTKNIKEGFYENLNKRIPLVLINGYNKDINCNFILSEETTGTIEALNHFKDKGYKRIGFLRGGNSYSYEIKENIYKKFFSDNQLPFSEENILRIETGNSVETVQQAKECVMNSLSKGNDFQGILCCNDFMAIGALNGARALGINIPDQLSIVGFDNTVISQMTEPVLSSVDQHMQELGEKAASRILEIIEDHDIEIKKTSIHTDLIIRET